MNWIMNKLKNLQNLFSANCCEPDTTSVSPTLSPEPETEPEMDYAEMSMNDLRAAAAARDLGDGRYKGVNRRQLTKLIKES